MTKGPPTMPYFFSEMEHATPELNSGRTPLEKNMQSLIQHVVKRHGWGNNHLENTRTHCDAAAGGDYGCVIFDGHRSG